MLKKEWQKHYKFLTWEYGKHHQKQSDGAVLQIFTLELVSKCKQKNQGKSCTKCLTCFLFFRNILLPFLINFNDAVSSNDKYEV